MSPEKKLSLKPLKQFAKEDLPRSSTLREILLQEPDKITATEFLTKFDIWTRLFNMEL